jgi:hypothetical protein
MDYVICRRVEDSPPINAPVVECSHCHKPVYAVDLLPDTPTPLCIYCTSELHPDAVVFVDLPPDEFGDRSMAVSVEQVLNRGDWHKNGAWHDQQFLLKHQT